MPSSRDAHATACAWLPAEIVITPRLFSSSPSADSVLRTPRTLNEPVRWKSSAFRCASAPSRSESVAERSSGVRWTRPWMTRCARSTSSSETIGGAYVARAGWRAGTASRTVNVVKPPGTLSTSTVPPIACVSSFTIASPSPVPTGRSRP